jgi:hypothetical protein
MARAREAALIREIRREEREARVRELADSFERRGVCPETALEWARAEAK